MRGRSPETRTALGVPLHDLRRERLLRWVPNRLYEATASSRLTAGGLSACILSCSKNRPCSRIARRRTRPPQNRTDPADAAAASQALIPPHPSTARLAQAHESGRELRRALAGRSARGTWLPSR